MKLTVLYHSRTDNTKKMAQVIAGGMETVEGIEAKIFPLEEIDEDWVKESACVVLGTPVYMASTSGAIKDWLDVESKKYGLAGKLGGAFATANYIHGGGEIAIQSILSHMMVLGMLTYSAGGACGTPVIHLGPVALGTQLDDSKETFKIYGQRMAAKAKELWS